MYMLIMCSFISVPNASFEIYSPSFTERFTESHAVMTQVIMQWNMLIYTYKYTCIMSYTCSGMWYKLVVYKKSIRHIYFQETTIFRKLKSASAIWNVWLMASLFFTSYFHFSWNHVWLFTNLLLKLLSAFADMGLGGGGPDLNKF